MTGRARVAMHGGIATLAAASALSSVFRHYGWLWPVVGAVAVVVVISELVRWSPVPSGLGPLFAAAGVTCYLTAAYAGSTAIVHVIPTGSSLQVLGDTARAGFHDIRTLGAPVPTHRGLVLIATVGIAAAALVVDLIAVTMRRAALAGLPLLAIFALSTSVSKHGASWWTFALGALGYLWLLLADSRDRLARWGRPLGYEREAGVRFNWSDQEVMPSPLSVMGRRIGVTAVAIGLVVPVLIPGLRGGVPHGSGGGLGLGGHGSSSRVTLNPIVNIQAELTAGRIQNVLSVQTSAPSPPYLRLTSLDRFDGTTFFPSTLQASSQALVSNGIPAVPVEGKPQTAEISVDNLQVPWLPVPQQVQSVQVPGDWRYDPASDTIFSARDFTTGKNYVVQSTTPTYTAAELRAASAPDLSMRRFTEAKVSPGVLEVARHVTAGAATPFDKAVAIQDYLTSSPFVYDPRATNTGSNDPLGNFLLVTHRGFCQQYASAMAVLARLAGIPSRVAVGFTAGEQQQDGSWLVTTRDAHAWPELYFTGVGWVPFEPTPRADGQAVAPPYSVLHVTPGKRPIGPTPGGNKNGANAGKNGASVSKNQRLDQASDANGVAAGGGAGGGHHHRARDLRTVGLWVLGAVVVLALVLPALVRALSRRRRWRRAQTPAERASAAWDELRASAIDARAGWIDGLTPRATARVLRAEAGGLATAEVRALDRLVEAVQRAWYAPDRYRVADDTLEDDVADLRVAMLAEATLRERLVLRVWPRSTLRAAREAVSRVGDLLDALDLAGARLRARLRPRHA